MTCWLLNDPDVVFVHIPRTAGTLVHALWQNQVSGHSCGHIPDSWQHLRKFAVVRDPEQRFFSALRMVNLGVPDTDVDVVPADPAQSALTVDAALAVLEDANVPFDGIRQYQAARFKHDALPQTHPFNCLYDADIILRTETLDTDVEWLRTAFGLKANLTQLKDVRGPLEREQSLPLLAEQRARLQAIYAQDYAQLGYSGDGLIVADPKVEKPVANGIWHYWPSFFADKVIGVTEAPEALPRDDVDLSVFARDRLLGKRGGTWPGRSENLIAHFKKLVPEFSNRPRILHLLGCCIVTIRKTKGSGPGLHLFHRIMSEHTEDVCVDMNTRWLVSICDTLADHGQSGAQKALGLCGSLLANTVKLAETERKLFFPPRPWPPNAKFEHGGGLFDGVIAFWTERGDMVKNILDRIEAVQAEDPVGGAVLTELMHRMMTNDTVYQRFSEIAGKPHPPLVPDWVRERFDQLARRRL
jgi:hypothetical protein